MITAAKLKRDQDQPDVPLEGELFAKTFVGWCGKDSCTAITALRIKGFDVVDIGCRHGTNMIMQNAAITFFRANPTCKRKIALKFSYSKDYWVADRTDFERYLNER